LPLAEASGNRTTKTIHLGSKGNPAFQLPLTLVSGKTKTVNLRLPLAEASGKRTTKTVHRCCLTENPAFQLPPTLVGGKTQLCK
jgi:hypothetical protein